MTPRYLLLLVCLFIAATTIAIPIPDKENVDRNSLGQHIGRAGLWVLGGAAVISMIIGSITYGTNWWHRFKVIKGEHEWNMTLWNATQARKEQEHQKIMEALDIILDVVKNYTDSIGKETTEFDPFAIADEMEAGVKEARADIEGVKGS